RGSPPHRPRPGASQRRQSSERTLLRLVTGDHDGLGAHPDRSALEALLTREGAVGHGVRAEVGIVARVVVLAEVAAAGLPPRARRAPGSPRDRAGRPAPRPP